MLKKNLKIIEILKRKVMKKVLFQNYIFHYSFTLLLKKVLELILSCQINLPYSMKVKL